MVTTSVPFPEFCVGGADARASADGISPVTARPRDPNGLDATKPAAKPPSNTSPAATSTGRLLIAQPSKAERERETMPGWIRPTRKLSSPDSPALGPPAVDKP